MDKLMGIEQRYERDFGEPWSVLEQRVRARHPEVFAILDQYDADEQLEMWNRANKSKRWWQIWK